MQKISPFLWFDDQAEEAAKFYASVFKNSKVISTTRYDEASANASGRPKGSVMTVSFELSGQEFTALNGGPAFHINPSISFFVNCESGEEVDEYWQKVSDGGKVLMSLDKYPFSERYGWVQDKYGVSWQITKTNPDGNKRPKFTPSIMFIHENAGKAKEAMEFYVSVFKDAYAGNVFPYEPADNVAEPAGNVAYEDFELLGEWFAAMDSSSAEHDFDLNEAVSFVVRCDDQAEIDYYWEKLSAVPGSEQCGWLKDKYGVSWQVVPENIQELIQMPGATGALMHMKKIDIEALKQAGKEQ